jgi:hypothetical protein
MLLHIVRGAGTLTAMKAMAQAARGEVESVPERGRVSEDVFFVAPDWRAQRVTHRAGERIAADTRGLLGEHLAAVLGDAG